jgi:hypothetical protein
MPVGRIIAGKKNPGGGRDGVVAGFFFCEEHKKCTCRMTSKS